MLFALLYVALISVNVVISAENVTSLSETDEQIRDFVMTVLLLRDVKHAQETGKGVQKATSEEFMHNRASVLKLADQTLKQVDSASAPVKTLFQKIFALETDKNNRDKEREAEIAEIEKVFGKLTESEKKEITTLYEDYSSKATALGLDDLMLTIKD
ncbi:hypothetical protein Y032_0006g2779 [Ancylostoma ceylanicum]|uniref:Nematode fatty acid retinoid binding protein n=1 Tax=Ancylostoma ceylanicum TaxID=53326 RepID=A0A016VNF0_9BILA|nr:hypothetical protein Y032_0006g2779 [Ancylostoma ceylanicum]